jgi:hypothetical protein
MGDLNGASKAVGDGGQHGEPRSGADLLGGDEQAARDALLTGRDQLHACRALKSRLSCRYNEMKYRYPARTPPIRSIAASAAWRAGSAKMVNGSIGAADLRSAARECSSWRGSD